MAGGTTVWEMLNLSHESEGLTASSWQARTGIQLFSLSGWYFSYTQMKPVSSQWGARQDFSVLYPGTRVKDWGVAVCFGWNEHGKG